MDEGQENVRRFLRAILHATGWSVYKLCKEAELSHTTIGRFLNDDTVTWTPTTRTLAKVRAGASKVLQPDFIDALWLTTQRPQTMRRDVAR